MHQSECLAKGGFKINGPPRVGKGPMESEEYQEMNKGASLPRPTQAGRIEQCQETIKEARRCLGNNDKDCVTKLIEELVKADCHNGNAVGREIADKVRDVVHELWLVSDNERRCELLSMLRSLDTSKRWVRDALHINAGALNTWFVRCGIDWENRMVRSNVVKVIEGLLREKFGWSETRMCEELWRFIGVDVDEFRRHGIEPCIWLKGLEGLSDLRRPYWLGLARSDMSIEKYNRGLRLALVTTNSVDAVFFPVLLSMVKLPSLNVNQENIPTAKYIHNSFNLSYSIYLDVDEWPWPTELSAYELEKTLNGFSDEGLAEYIAGEIDGDGTVWYEGSAYVRFAACKNCPKRVILDVLKEVIAERFGITGSINQLETADALTFGGEKAVRLLRHIIRYIHHPLRRLRAELILALYDGKISKDEFTKLYEQTEYERGGPDIKRNRGLEALARAAPQTHTHG
jgi:hypothetical protein